MFLRVCGQRLSRGLGLLRESDRLLPFLVEQLGMVCGFRLQLRIEPLDGPPGLGQLIHKNLLRRLVLRRLSPLRRGRLHRLLGPHSRLCPRLHGGLIAPGLPKRQ
jgi:hypothetical protein